MVVGDDVASLRRQRKRTRPHSVVVVVAVVVDLLIMKRDYKSPIALLLFWVLTMHNMMNMNVDYVVT